MKLPSRRHFLGLFTACLLSFPSVATAQAEAHQQLVDSVDAIVRASMEDPTAVALSVAVAKDDVIVFDRGYGLAEVEHEVRADARTIFRIGSITKQVTAAAICRLAEQYEVDLDADMTDYVPDFPTQGRVVTLRHLLTHTSGIPSYTGLGSRWSRTVSMELPHEELLGMVANLPFEFEPGTAFNYNNTGYYLLGVVIENVTGESYADYVRTQFFEPLKLTRTRYGSNRDLIPNRAQGYQFLDGEIANDDLIGMSQPYAAGSLLSTARDLVAWDIALRGGKVVDPATYEEMVTPFMLENANEVEYGFGLFIGERNGSSCIYHGGGINGFNSILTHYPEAGLTLSVISNSESFSAGEVESRILTGLLSE